MSLPMLQGAADAHRFATRRDDYLRMVANAEAAEREAHNERVLRSLDADLRRLRLLAHIARAKGQRVDVAGAAAEIIAAAAERLGEVDRG